MILHICGTFHKILKPNVLVQDTVYGNITAIFSHNCILLHLSKFAIISV